jgi:hypothetical protein
MAGLTEPAADHGNCPICRHIPDHKFVETLHTDARLPEQVNQLEILGGYGLYGYGNEQVRKCPLCKTYYTYLSDHDSESGVGIGWTDEEIMRITPESAPDVMERVLETSQHALEHWTNRFQETQDPYAQRWMTEQTEEVNRLTQEIASLEELMGIGE